MEAPKYIEVSFWVYCMLLSCVQVQQRQSWKRSWRSFLAALWQSETPSRSFKHWSQIITRTLKPNSKLASWKWMIGRRVGSFLSFWDFLGHYFQVLMTLISGGICVFFFNWPPGISSCVTRLPSFHFEPRTPRRSAFSTQIPYLQLFRWVGRGWWRGVPTLGNPGMFSLNFETRLVRFTMAYVEIIKIASTLLSYVYTNWLINCFGLCVVGVVASGCFWIFQGYPVRDLGKKQEEDEKSEDGDATALEAMSEEEKFLGSFWVQCQVLFVFLGVVPGTR